MIGEREGGRGGADAEGAHRHYRCRVAAIAAAGAQRVADVLDGHVEVSPDRRGHDVGETGQQGGHTSETAPAVELPGERRRHLVAVLLAQRGRAEVQQQSIERHHALPATTPVVWAMRTIACSRAVSARATSSPNGVIR